MAPTASWARASLCVVALVAAFAATYHLPAINDAGSTDNPRPRRHQLHHGRGGGPRSTLGSMYRCMRGSIDRSIDGLNDLELAIGLHLTPCLDGEISGHSDAQSNCFWYRARSVRHRKIEWNITGADEHGCELCKYIVPLAHNCWSSTQP
ncbi:hypothetical protein MPTK1_6g12870 [Marchantia polymorpha subsp. ruderalis]|uniref:S-protein homolog n=2 Tax=Marchantia polymorpha TaxID=3197 RepID=A0AAF6BRF6_MARPO|nr:hypothetical protein MARPO_0059s0061 [Marchantia polymorpha]BBN14590.1 hypothetical protein Mp_6g12870 [Marchantia polymorpha subsp. ruderalis]|eukprot:PTQ37131.1 hypothetical protein MARPO_0059s0061 [Marchantia polymorpha]